MEETESFITLKDHKEDFPHKISCRLINPSKSEIGKISKIIIENINNKIRSITQINQWKNTSSVIEWFNNISNKRKTSFIIFDIESFYPSISLNLFEKTIQYAKSICNITEKDLSIIMQARKTLLFHKNEPWDKLGSYGLL